MKYIYPDYKFCQEIPLYSEELYKDCLELIERCARNCYQSEPKDTNTLDFLDRLFNYGHYSIFEHSNFVIKSKDINNKDDLFLYPFYNNRYIKVFIDEHGYHYLGGNLRAWFEALQVVTSTQNKWHSWEHFHDLTPKLLLSLCNCFLRYEFEIVSNIRTVPLSLRRYIVKIIHDRAFTHELVRHRVMSFSQESQRYCNYSQERFGKEVTYIFPPNMYPSLKNRFLHYIACWVTEKMYFLLMQNGETAQIARSVLPNACKTSVYVSGDYEGWKHLFELRTSQKAHPDMRAMMVRLQEQMLGD